MPLLLGVLSGALSAAFGWLFYDRFVKNADCLAVAKSSCIAADGSNVTAGSLLWSLFALFFAVLCVGFLVTAARRRQSSGGKAPMKNT